MRIAFYTLGCKVNQYETQALERLCRVLGISLPTCSTTTSGRGGSSPPSAKGRAVRYLSSQEWAMVRDYGILTVQGREMVDVLLELLLALSPLPCPRERGGCCCASSRWPRASGAR